MNDFAIKVLTAPIGQTHIFSVGQAGYIIKNAVGQILGIDLYLSDCVERAEGHIGFKRLMPHILEPNDLEFDFLIATHPHLDHFDADALPVMTSNHHTKLYASVECEKEISRLNMNSENITYVKPGDSITTGEFKLDFINCDHGKGAPDAVGVIVNADGKNICEVGDTCLRLDRIDEYNSKGRIDVLIAPINGAYGNLNESECAKLSAALMPEITIPCHYGMFASHGGEPGRFLDIMKTQYPNNKFLLMSMGEKFTF